MDAREGELVKRSHKHVVCMSVRNHKEAFKALGLDGTMPACLASSGHPWIYTILCLLLLRFTLSHNCLRLRRLLVPWRKPVCLLWSAILIVNE